jgi:hypothetical protein
MFSLEQLLGPEKANQAVEQISQQAGLEPSAVDSVVRSALPMILGGLANNASTPEGAESLNAALETDHDGSILENLGGLGSMIFGRSTEAGAPPRQADAGGILGHILGNEQGAVTQQVSQKTGVSMGQVAQILMFLAPIVMAYLGREKQQTGVGADGLGGLLGGLLGGQAQAASGSGNPILDMASGVLDRDRDGSSMDDIASMAFDYLSKR